MCIAQQLNVHLRMYQCLVKGKCLVLLMDDDDNENTQQLHISKYNEVHLF